MQLIRDNGRVDSLLYEFSKRLNASAGKGDIVRKLPEYLKDALKTDAVILLESGGMLENGNESSAGFALTAEDRAAAMWAFEHVESAGCGTKASPDSDWYFMPMRGGGRSLGVIGLGVGDAGKRLSGMNRRVACALRDQASVALEKERLSAIAQTKLTAETERLRAALLSSVSHDLRTPLVSIIGAASSLLEMGPRLDEKASRELLKGLLGEAERLNRFVQNLLDMTRLGYGATTPNFGWHDLHDIVGEPRGGCAPRSRG